MAMPKQKSSDDKRNSATQKDGRSMDKTKSTAKNPFEKRLKPENEEIKCNCMPDWEKLKLKLSKPLPFLRKGPWKPKNHWEKIFFNGTRHNLVARVLGTTMLCQIVGAFFYFYFQVKPSKDPRLIAVLTAVGFAFLTYAVLLIPTIKIIFYASLPSLFTSRLRTVVALTTLSLAFQYPAMNVVNNIQSSVDGIVCVQSRVKAVADEVLENANKKLQELPIDEAHELVDKAMKPYNDMKKVLRKVGDTVSTMLEWQRKITSKIKNLFESCSIMARQPYIICTTKLNEFYHDCLDNTFEFVCEPILFLKNQCHLTRFLIDFCEWPASIRNNIKEGVGTYAKNSMHTAIDLTRNTTFFKIYEKTRDTINGSKQAYDTMNFTVKHNYTIEHKMNLEIAQFRERIKDDASFFQNSFNLLASIVRYLIQVMLVHPAVMGLVYVIKFNRKDGYDNFFITDEFYKIEGNRETIHSKKIMPMSKIEQSKYIKASSCRLSSHEKLKLWIRIAMLLVGSFVPLLFVCVDLLTYTVVEAGYDFFHNNFTRIDQPNLYQLKVTGTGFLNALLSNILEVFQPVSEFAKSKDEMWRGCFEEPIPPNYDIFYIMLGNFIFAFLLCFAELYVTRLRHLIAEHYFPQRKRPRALYLYKTILESRKNILNQTLQLAADKIERLRIQKKKGKKEPEKKEEELEVNLPDIKTKQCVRCARIDLKLTNSSNTRICVNCKILYCVDCYSVRKKCLDCGWPLQQVAKNTEFYVDSSCSDDSDA